MPPRMTRIGDFLVLLEVFFAQRRPDINYSTLMIAPRFRTTCVHGNNWDVHMFET
ncbi:hypothetical protein ACKRZS_006962 [Fusarium odoratissimum]